MAICRRKTFLPAAVKNCELTEVFYGRYARRHKAWDYGFDRSGRYYSIVDNDIMLQSDGSIQVAFLSYNSIEKKIDKHVVVLRRKKSEWNVEQCFPSLYDLIYDANLTRWFSITYDDDNEEMRNRIVINSGCIHEEVTSTGQYLIEFN